MKQKSPEFVYKQSIHRHGYACSILSSSSLEHQTFVQFEESEDGVAAIEFAILAPVLMLFLLGAIEYGIYFNRSQIVERAVSTVATSIQLNPTDTGLQAFATSQGLSSINLNTLPNYICAAAYTTSTDASSGCAPGIWDTAAPLDGAGKPVNSYYIVVKAHAEYQNISPIFKTLLPNNTLSTVIDSQQVVQVGSTKAVPVCNEPGKVLQYDGTQFVCVVRTTPTTCPASVCALTFAAAGPISGTVSGNFVQSGQSYTWTCSSGGGNTGTGVTCITKNAAGITIGGGAGYGGGSYSVPSCGCNK